jgi:hypothetical protein
MGSTTHTLFLKMFRSRLSEIKNKYITQRTEYLFRKLNSIRMIKENMDNLIEPTAQ